eukprot:5891787-Pyramimonas_sp.AAC.2
MATDAKKRSRSEDEPSLSQLRWDVRGLDREMLVQVVLELATTPPEDYLIDSPLSLICHTVQDRIAHARQSDYIAGERSSKVVVRAHFRNLQRFSSAVQARFSSFDRVFVFGFALMGRSALLLFSFHSPHATSALQNHTSSSVLVRALFRFVKARRMLAMSACIINACLHMLATRVQYARWP